MNFKLFSHHRLFIASSFDVKQERDRFEEIIPRVNRILQKGEVNVQFDLWRWEKDLIPNISLDGIQALINPELDKASIIVILIWNRIGPGTLEEYERAIERYRYNDVRVLLYLCERESQFTSSEQLEDKRRVIDFVDRVKSHTAYRTFVHLATFSEMIEEHLLAVATELSEASYSLRQYPNVNTIEETKSADLAQRYLSTAARGIPSESTIMALSSHLRYHSAETSVVNRLPGELATLLSLRQSFAFRLNATQALKDSMEVTFLHEIDKDSHASRPGEEGADIATILTKDFTSRHINSGKILYSDVDHPSIKEIVKSYWPETSICMPVSLADFVIRNQSEDLKANCIDRYISAIDNNNDVRLVIIPHIVWINGAVFPVKEICHSIKKISPLTTIIVDGAQATGHIPLDIETCSTENHDIDFYVGCGHKWLMGPETLGFTRVGSRFRDQCAKCKRILTASDQITDSSAVAFEYQGAQIGTQQRGVACGMLNAISEIEARYSSIEARYLEILVRANSFRTSLSSIDELVLLDPGSSSRSGIVSFSFEENRRERCNRIFSNLNQFGYFPVLYSSDIHLLGSPDDQFFVRLSPRPDFPMEGIAEVATIINKSLKK